MRVKAHQQGVAVGRGVLERLRGELAKVIAAPDVTEAFRKAGGRPMALSLADTRALVQGDVTRWTRLIQDAGVRGE